MCIECVSNQFILQKYACYRNMRVIEVIEVIEESTKSHKAYREIREKYDIDVFNTLYLNQKQ